MNSRFEINQILKYLEQQRLELRKEYNQLPVGRLSVFEGKYGVRCNTEFFQGKKRVRKGITGNTELIKVLSRKALLQEKLTRLEKNINTLNHTIKEIQDESDDAAFCNLPTKLRTLIPQEYFLPRNDLSPQPSYELSNIQTLLIDIPDDQIKTWGTKPYLANSYHVEEKKIVMSGGLRVRSKSESMIVEIYQKLQIPFHYDELLITSNGKISPDIISLRRDGKLIYHEHCGLVNNIDYMARHKKKLDIYERYGVVPWDNLIVSYDSPDNGFNIELIEAEIRAKHLL